MAKYGVGIIGAGWVAGRVREGLPRPPADGARRASTTGRRQGDRAARRPRRRGARVRVRRRALRRRAHRHHRLVHAPGLAARALRARRRDRAAHRDREADRALARRLARDPRRGREGGRQDGDELRAALEPAVPDRQAADRGRRPRRPRLRRGRLLAPVQDGLPRLPVVRDEGRRAAAPFVCGGCHAVDILRFLGGEIVEVAAFSAPKRINQDFEYDPSIVASLRFENGAVGKLSTDPRRRHAVHLQLQALRDRGHDHQQRGLLVEALPGEPRLLEVPDDRAGLGRGRAPPVQGGDRPLHRVHRERRRVARLDPRHAGSRWRCASRSTSRRRRAASRSRCRSRRSSAPDDCSWLADW